MGKHCFVEALNKIALYLQAAAALRSPHWPGIPFFPKSLCAGIPYSRSAYNSFIAWIKRLELPTATQVVDVGANHGDFARAANTWYPAAQVLLVEPLPKMQRCLEKAIQDGRRNWRLLPCALGAEPGRLPLFVDENHDDIGSLAGFSEEYSRTNPEARASKEIICDVKTLDAAAAEAGIDHIDLLKVDVEGFEFEVLQGAERVLGKTTAVIIEVSLVRKAGDANALVAMLDRLAKQGFDIVAVIPSLFDPQQPWRPREFNVLARRPK
jgi:FkbM family methyltransferase